MNRSLCLDMVKKDIEGTFESTPTPTLVEKALGCMHCDNMNIDHR
jgi:hypothetical protein